MEIHFYEKLPEWCNLSDYYLDYDSTSMAIYGDDEDVEEYIMTTQMCLLSTGLLLKGYMVFIHYAKGDVYEIKLYESRTPNHIKITPSKNLYAMWASGALSI